MQLDDVFSKYHLSSFCEYIDGNIDFISAFGNNEFRMKWIYKIKESGGNFALLIHPAAYISPKTFVK